MAFQPIAINQIFRPSFEITESMSPEIGDRNENDKVRAILNYEVVEKTKSFAILRINYVQLLNTKRKY